MEMEQTVAEADAFTRRAMAVTLDSLATLSQAVAGEFHDFQTRVDATKGFWIQMHGWDRLSKPELVDLARQRKVTVHTSDSKGDLLAAVVSSFWSELDAAAAYNRARAESDRIRMWAKRLNEVPENLQGLIDSANAYYEKQWVGKLDTIHGAASVLRWNALTLMEWEWAATRAHHALEGLEKGKALADVIHILAHEVQMAIMGVIATNLNASGSGLEHMGHIGGAKLLTRAFYHAVPEQAKPFLSTVYR